VSPGNSLDGGLYAALRLLPDSKEATRVPRGRRYGLRLSTRCKDGVEPPVFDDRAGSELRVIRSSGSSSTGQSVLECDVAA
jgi:hypothetical protein